MTSDVDKASQEARQKAEQTAEAIGLDSHPDVVKPVGVLDSEQSRISSRRYADRAEGLDQFGGEESERQRVPNAEMEGTSEASERLKNYAGNPGGIDTFGGEETERKA